jgi:hypothetical protein
LDLTKKFLFPFAGDHCCHTLGCYGAGCWQIMLFGWWLWRSSCHLPPCFHFLIIFLASVLGLFFFSVTTFVSLLLPLSLRCSLSLDGDDDKGDKDGTKDNNDDGDDDRNNEGCNNDDDNAYGRHSGEYLQWQ